MTGAQFDEGMALYDSSDIVKTEFKIKPEDFPLCYASTMKRAFETAKLIYAGKVLVSEELVEVKSASGFLRRIKIPALLRHVAGRIAWFLNDVRMPETRARSMERAERFITMVLENGKENTIIVSHGFFMHCLKSVLRKKGFKGKLSLFPMNGHPYVFEKE